MRRHTTFTVVMAIAALMIMVGTSSVTWAVEPEVKTVEGELLDLRCYTSRGAPGEAHQACGAACATRGLPIGVLNTDGKAYTLLVASPAYADYINKSVRITGKVTNMMLSPTKMEIKEGDSWKVVELSKEMM